MFNYGNSVIIKEKTDLERFIMFGISVYPDKATAVAINQYISKAAGLGYKRIFTCMLSFEGSVEDSVEVYSQMIAHARSEGMEVYIDVAPRVFDALGLEHGNTEFFHKLGASGIRLDMGFSGMEEAFMTYNPYDLNVEINMSMESHHLETILDHHPRHGKLMGCHNFYPQRESGITIEQFERTSKKFYDNHIRSAAFIGSQVAEHGPWPVTEGLVTLEMHRDLEMVVQAKHLMLLGYIDDIIIANMFASDEELEAIINLERGMVTFELIDCERNSEIEDKILFEHDHFNRGDYNQYTMRSIMSRIIYKGVDNPPRTNVTHFKRGDVVIGSDYFGQYKNELQVILLDSENRDYKRNLVGRIREEELFLLDVLKPWQHFKFNPSKK